MSRFFRRYGKLAGATAMVVIAPLVDKLPATILLILAISLGTWWLATEGASYFPQKVHAIRKEKPIVSFLGFVFTGALLGSLIGIVIWSILPNHALVSVPPENPVLDIQATPPTAKQSEAESIPAVHHDKQQHVEQPTQAEPSVIGSIVNKNSPVYAQQSITNNFGPPPAQLSFTEEVVSPLAENQQKYLKVHVKTDRPITGARIGMRLSGSFEMPIQSVREPIVLNSGLSRVNWGSLTEENKPIPIPIPIPIPSDLRCSNHNHFYQVRI